MGVSAAGDITPAGKLAHFALSSAPPGWLKANGALVSRAIYAALFNQIGVMFGAGDGVTTFALPDCRGQFLRGLDDGKGVDTGRVLGSMQTDGTAAHNHVQQGTTTTAGTGSPSAATPAAAGSAIYVGGTPALVAMYATTANTGGT